MHYLDQQWPIIGEFPWHFTNANHTGDIQAINQYIHLLPQPHPTGANGLMPVSLLTLGMDLDWSVLQSGDSSNMVCLTYWGQLRHIYIGGSSTGLGKAQCIDSSLRADWLSCFSLAWWEWRVARQGCLVPLMKGGMWQSSRPASFSSAGLTLWPSWLECWLATLSGLSVQVRIPEGLLVAGTLHCYLPQCAKHRDI